MSLVNDHWSAKIFGERIVRTLRRRNRRWRDYLVWPPFRRCAACKWLRLRVNFYREDKICRKCWDRLWAATFK